MVIVNQLIKETSKMVPNTREFQMSKKTFTTISEVIYKHSGIVLKNIKEDNTILGVVVDPGLRNAVAGSVVTILSLAVQGMYSLYVLDESPSESLL